ncbi:MAG TPA: hypothetical protein VHB50_17615 [Bryobacteraceae bacterium]|nr:hypothetical protein [Bryobacteraceae bacterium]
MLLLLPTAFAAGAEQTFTGVITDSMCGANHRMMKITPDAKCARECVKSGQNVKFALIDGPNVYKLSDQATPAQFAGQRVKVLGTLFPKTGIIRVQKIELARQDRKSNSD